MAIVDQHGKPIDQGVLKEPQTSRVSSLQNEYLVSEVIGPPAPQIVPKKHVALACLIWQGGTQHRQRPK